MIVGFQVKGDSHDEMEICAVDALEQVLTSISRLDELHQNGFRFEAAVAQAALVEGLLLHYLLIVLSQVINAVLQNSRHWRQIRSLDVLDVLDLQPLYFSALVRKDIFIPSTSKTSRE